MSAILKVTAFILRPGSQGAELLLLRHPTAGVQLPAGTVEPGEYHAAAAVREACEETGLPITPPAEYLGLRTTTLPPDRRVDPIQPGLRPPGPHQFRLDPPAARRHGHPAARPNGYVQVEYVEWGRHHTDITGGCRRILVTAWSATFICSPTNTPPRPNGKWPSTTTSIALFGRRSRRCRRWFRRKIPGFLSC